ncbi:MAG: aminodeoxychorismate synthase component I [Bacillota bacterium]|nr:aminodeoxychorismate synthase component I [Bacillota bacterium]
MKLIFKKINTDLDAFDIYNIFSMEKNTVILDSGSDHDTLGRYSFIGINPFLTLKYENGILLVNDKKEKGNVFIKLKEILKEYSVENSTDIPFIAGGIGYLSYDIGREIEVLPSTAAEDVHIPQLYYNFYDNIIIKDNLKNETYISALGISQDSETSIKNISQKIENGHEVKYTKVTEEINKGLFNSNFTQKEYLAAVDKVRDFIRSGDVYILNLTQRFTCNCNRESYEVYKDLRHINPAPFAAFLNFEDFSILSSSPERFLKIRNGVVETRPIKGTRPRGKDAYTDNLYKQELLNSEKDKSELLMIVDLERNDLSKVCKPHSVKVPELFKLEAYPSVFHLVSTITGELKAECNCIDCIEACFPGGSITGAPKIRSMEIIDELEKVRRNIYTGCIGYIGFDESVDLNIVIRTIHIQDGKAYFGVGGGITWESETNFEYEETLHKAAALMRALSNEVN